MTAASCAAVTGAIVGAIAAGASNASAATAPVAHIAHVAVQAPAPVRTSASASASATPSAAPTSAKPSAPATTKAAAPATTKPAPAPVVTHADPYAGQSAYQIAQRIVPSGEFGCFDWIVTRESGWSVTATNPSSGAYGLGQALPGDKMASVGADWRTNPVTQIKWTLGYMDSRYGSPCAAQSFWESHNWY